MARMTPSSRTTASMCRPPGVTGPSAELRPAVGTYPGFCTLLHQTGWKELSTLILTAQLGQAGGYRRICLGREPMENGMGKGVWDD